MRILHTSDWHLGRTFLGASLLDEQAEMVERIVALTAEHQVELVVVAGDLYDRSIPPAPAVALFGHALVALRRAGARVAAISGNHDSSIRVGVADGLLNELGVAVRGEVGRIAEPLLLPDPADGGPPIAVYLVPYLEPSVDGPVLQAMADAQEEASRVLTAAPSGPAAEPTLFDLVAAPAPPAGGAVDPPVESHRRINHDQVTRLAGDAIRRHLRTLGTVRSVVVAHAFVAGGRVSDSERDLSVGGVERVAVDTFAGFDLVTLGHLHQPQQIAGDRVAYSGSPLPYSFSEEGQEKSVRLVDLAADGSVTAQVLPLGVGRPLRTLTGDLAALLQDPALADATGARVRVRLTDAHLPNQAMAKLRSRFPHAVELRHEPAGVEPAVRTSATDLGVLESLSPLDLAVRFWAEQQGAEATPAEQDVLARAVAATLGDEP